MRKAFQVKDLDFQRTIEFTPVNDFNWNVKTISDYSTSVRSMTNEEVEKSKNYFLSQWMHYDLDYKD